MRVRRDKLDRLRAEGVEPYPVAVRRTTTNAALRQEYPELAPDAATGEFVSVVGRVVLKHERRRAVLRDAA